MNVEERREASRSFSETLREKVTASREAMRLEALMGTDPGESTIVKREDEDGDRG